MVVTEYRGHKLSNGASAIAFFYPEVSGGHDMLKDLKNQADPENIDTKILFLLYAAFRKAGDPEARKKTKEELVDEIDFLDPKAINEFREAMSALMSSESSSSIKKG